MRTLLVVSLCSASLSVAAEATLLDQRPTIRVTGSAHVEAPPDKVDLFVHITTVQPTVDAAMTENAKLFGAMMNATRAAGIAPADVQLSGVNVNPTEERDDSGRIRSTKYAVNKTLVLCLHDPSKLDPLLLGLSNARVQVSNIAFSSSALTKLLPGLPLKAVENARASADTLAAALRSKAGRALKVGAVWVGSPSGNNGATYSGGGGVSVGAAGTGALSADARVDVDFELFDDGPKPR